MFATHQYFNIDTASDKEVSFYLFGVDSPPKGLEYVIPQFRKTTTFGENRQKATTEDEGDLIDTIRSLLENQELVNNEHAGVRHSLMITIDALCDTLSVLIKSKEA